MCVYAVCARFNCYLFLSRFEIILEGTLCVCVYLLLIVVLNDILNKRRTGSSEKMFVWQTNTHTFCAQFHTFCAPLRRTRFYNQILLYIKVKVRCLQLIENKKKINII